MIEEIRFGMSGEHRRLRQEGWNVRIYRPHPFLFRPQFFMSFQSFSSEKPKHQPCFFLIDFFNSQSAAKKR